MITMDGTACRWFYTSTRKGDTTEDRDLSHHGQDVDLDLTGKRIISIDPGPSDLVTCLSHREDGTQVLLGIIPTRNYAREGSVCENTGGVSAGIS